jgi:hypothetical protein
VFILNNDCWCSSSLSWILRCGTQVDSLSKNKVVLKLSSFSCAM